MTTPQDPNATHPPQQNTPPQAPPNQAPPAQQQPRPQVNVTPPPDNSDLRAAIDALPDKLANTFKEIFPSNPRNEPPAQQQQQQQSTQPPAQQQQQQQQPPPERWNFGRWYMTGKGRSQ